MKQIMMSLALVVSLSACTQAQQSSENSNDNAMNNTSEPSNKEKAVAVLNSLETGDESAIGYINPEKYIQHNLAVGDGLAGFGEVMAHAPEGGFKAKVVRAFTDGDYVFTHTEYDFFGDKVGFDVFRFEDGLIVEHWDNLLEKTPLNPSGRSQTDGPTEVGDLSATAANKELVSRFIDDILVNGKMNLVTQYFDGDQYIQHNPAVADGLSGLEQALEAMAKQGVTMVYDKVHKVLGEGNFVLAISEGTFGGQATSYYDLFRVENGKIAEHWDVMEPILPESEWKNTNGKFNFE